MNLLVALVMQPIFGTSFLLLAANRAASGSTQSPAGSVSPRSVTGKRSASDLPPQEDDDLGSQPWHRAWGFWTKSGDHQVRSGFLGGSTPCEVVCTIESMSISTMKLWMEIEQNGSSESEDHQAALSVASTALAVRLHLQSFGTAAGHG